MNILTLQSVSKLAVLNVFQRKTARINFSFLEAKNNYKITLRERTTYMKNAYLCNRKQKKTNKLKGVAL